MNTIEFNTTNESATTTNMAAPWASPKQTQFADRGLKLEYAALPQVGAGIGFVTKQTEFLLRALFQVPGAEGQRTQESKEAGRI